MQIKETNVELKLDNAQLPTSRELLVDELKRCRAQARTSGYEISDSALERMADNIWAVIQKKELGSLQERIAQLVRANARPIQREAGRLYVSNGKDQTNRHERRKTAALSRRKR